MMVRTINVPTLEIYLNGIITLQRSLREKVGGIGGANEAQDWDTAVPDIHVLQPPCC